MLTRERSPERAVLYLGDLPFAQLAIGTPSIGADELDPPRCLQSFLAWNVPGLLFMAEASSCRTLRPL